MYFDFFHVIANARGTEVLFLKNMFLIIWFAQLYVQAFLTFTDIKEWLIDKLEDKGLTVLTVITALWVKIRIYAPILLVIIYVQEAQGTVTKLAANSLAVFLAGHLLVALAPGLLVVAIGAINLLIKTLTRRLVKAIYSYRRAQQTKASDTAKPKTNT